LQEYNGKIGTGHFAQPAESRPAFFQFSRRRMIKTAIATTLIVALSGFAWLYKRDSDTSLPPMRTVPVERGDLQFTIEATGTVEPEEVVDVGAQVAGKIQSLGADPRSESKTIDYGSPVKVGTVLARIDDSLYQSDVEQAQAQVESSQALLQSTQAGVQEAQANVERAEKDLLQLQAKQYQAQRDWKRAQGTWKSSPGAISESDFDLAKSTYEAADAAVGVGNAAIAQANALLSNAKAAVVKANADLSNARAIHKRAMTNLGYCTIKSPVEGVIIDRRINVGQTVVSSLNSPSLFLIAKDLKRLQVWASVNEADIGNIHSGQSVRFTVDGTNQKFKGVVAPDQPRLNASMNQNVVTYTVVVNTDNSNGLLIPYRTADLQFEVTRHENVLLVPNSALRWQPSPERAAASGLPDSTAGTKARNTAKHAQEEADSGAESETILWTLEGDRLVPVKVRTILSDGTLTEVAGEGLKEGALVVVGEEVIEGGKETADPFLPKVFGSRRSQ
jgi:HlyD family secretion protein